MDKCYLDSSDEETKYYSALEESDKENYSECHQTVNHYDELNDFGENNDNNDNNDNMNFFQRPEAKTRSSSSSTSTQRNYYLGNSSSTDLNNVNELKLKISKNHNNLNDTDCNTTFQEIVQKTPSSVEEKFKILNEMKLIKSEFESRALKSGKKIIEMTPEQRKQNCIKKGIAGGQKFKFDQIFFKFATDNKEIYGGDEFAKKAAGHELRSMVELVNLGTTTLLNLPIACIIDYLGHRLVAMSNLPIHGNETLVYGSADGGKTFLNRIPEAEKAIRDIAVHLNLKPHKFKGHIIYTCADLEIHYGFDGRFYIIDAPRLWPPTFDTDSRRKKGSMFYNLLRPEFLKKYPIPLSSDGLTGFGKHDPDSHTHNQELQVASKYLQTVSSKNCIIHLLNNYNHLKKSQNLLVQYLHKFGVNLRYFNRIYLYLTSVQPDSNHYYTAKKIKTKVIIEIVARTLKVIIQNQWRALQSGKTEDFKVVLYDILKSVEQIAKSENTTRFPNFLQILKTKIELKYDFNFKLISPNLLPRLSKIFRRTQKFLGVKLIENIGTPKRHHQSQLDNLNLEVLPSVQSENNYNIFSKSFDLGESLRDSAWAPRGSTEKSIASSESFSFQGNLSQSQGSQGNLSRSSYTTDERIRLQGSTKNTKSWIEDEPVSIRQKIEEVMDSTENFLASIIVEPTIKSYAFKSHYDLHRTLIIEGTDGLYRMERELLRELEMKQNTLQDKNHPTILPLASQLSTCYSLLFQQQNVTLKEGYIKAVEYIKKSEEFLDLCIEISNSLNNYQHTLKFLTEKALNRLLFAKERQKCERHVADHYAWGFSSVLVLSKIFKIATQNEINHFQTTHFAKCLLYLAELYEESECKQNLILNALHIFNLYSQVENQRQCYILLSKLKTNNIWIEKKLSSLDLGSSIEIQKSERIIELIQELAEKNSAQLASEYLNLSEIYLKQNKSMQALRYIRDAYRIYTKLGDEGSPIGARCFLLEAQAFLKKNDNEKFFISLLRAEQLFEQTVDPSKFLTYANCLYYLCQYHSIMDQEETWFNSKTKKKIQAPALFGKTWQLFLDQKTKGGELMLQVLLERHYFRKKLKEFKQFIPESEIHDINPKKIRSSGLGNIFRAKLSKGAAQYIFKEEQEKEEKERKKEEKKSGLENFSKEFQEKFESLKENEKEQIILRQFPITKFISGVVPEEYSRETFLNDFHFRNLRNPSILSTLDSWSFFQNDIENITKGTVYFDYIYSTSLLPSRFGLLSEIIEKNCLTSNEKKNITLGLVSGLNYLHSIHILHFHFSSYSIFCDPTSPNPIKITDFGLAQDFSSVNEPQILISSNIKMLNPFLTPPEFESFFKNTHQFNFFQEKNFLKKESLFKSCLIMNHNKGKNLPWEKIKFFDHFGLGLILWELAEDKLVTSIEPKEPTSNEIERARLNIKSEFWTNTSNITPNFQKLLNQLLASDPSNRPHLNRVHFQISESPSYLEKNTKKNDIESEELQMPIVSDLDISFTSFLEHFARNPKLHSQIFRYDFHQEIADWLITQTRTVPIDVLIEKKTPLFIASQYQCEKLVSYLLENGANVDGFSQETPLWAASLKGSEKIVTLLLENGADVNKSQTCTPLSIAVQNSHSNVVKLLLQNKADINIRDDTGLLPYEIAVNKKDTTTINLLQQFGQVSNSRPRSIKIEPIKKTATESPKMTILHQNNNNNDSVNLNSLTNSEIQNSGNLEGFLLKKGEKHFQQVWKQRYFRFNTHKLFYSNQPNSEPKGFIDINLIKTINTFPQKPNLFDIVTPKRVFKIGADSPEIAQKWVDHIKNLKNYYQSKIN